MPAWVAIVLVLAAFAAILYAARRAIVVFEVHAERGRVVKAKGRMPPELLRDVGDVLERAKATGSLSGKLDGGRIAVQASGLDEPTVQRIRNVVGRFPTARIKTSNRLP